MIMLISAPLARANRAMALKTFGSTLSGPTLATSRRPSTRASVNAVQIAPPVSAPTLPTSA